VPTTRFPATVTAEWCPRRSLAAAAPKMRLPVRGASSRCGTLPRVPAPRYPDPVERITVDLAKDWLSVADLCEYMGVSTFVITRVLRSGELPAVKMGREWRVSRIDFEDWLNAQRFAAALEQRRPAR
jgi:excisionase family DNA binding protein